MVLLNTQLHFAIEFMAMAGIRIPAFLYPKNLFFDEFLYYITNMHKYKGKTA